MFEIIIKLQHFSLPFHPSKPSQYTPPCSTSIYSLLFCIYIYVPIYNLLSPYDVTCMYVCRADHLVPGNLSQLSSVAYSSCVCLNPHGLFSIQFGMSIGIILAGYTFGQSCWWDFMGVSSDITRRHSLIANSMILYLLVFLLLFCNFPGS